SDGTIAPVVTPVRNVKLNGSDLASPVIGAGSVALVTWDAPVTGTPTSYFVTLEQVTAADTATQLSIVATLTTSLTSLLLPTYVMTPGASYLLVIRADAIAGYDPAAPFLTSGLSQFRAAMVTAQFTL